MSDMHGCREYQEAMHRVLDGGQCTLTGEVREHVECCDSCRELWQQLLAAEEALSEAARAELVEIPGARLHGRIMQAIGREKPAVEARRARRFAAMLATAAVIVAGVISVALIISRPGEPKLAHARAAATPRVSVELPTLQDLSTAAAEVAAPLAPPPVHKDLAWLSTSVWQSAESAMRAVGGSPE